MSGTEFSGLASELTMFTSGGGGDVSSNTDKTASYKSYGDSFSGGGEKTTNFFSCKSPSK
jgi:hypothetical protein